MKGDWQSFSFFPGFHTEKYLQDFCSHFHVSQYPDRPLTDDGSWHSENPASYEKPLWFLPRKDHCAACCPAEVYAGNRRSFHQNPSGYPQSLFAGGSEEKWQRANSAVALARIFSCVCRFFSSLFIMPSKKLTTQSLCEPYHLSTMWSIYGLCGIC